MSDLLDHSRTFEKHLDGMAWQPDIYYEDEETLYEWVADSRHAVVSVEADGHYGYAMLLGDVFRAGKTDDPHVSVFPDDLMGYLS